MAPKHVADPFNSAAAHSVAAAEVASLKPDARVYTRKSNLFFRTTKEDALESIQQQQQAEQELLRQQQQQPEKASKPPEKASKPAKK